MQVAKQKELGIWLEDETIMSEFKITKVLTITWETADSANIDKSREVATEKLQSMVFIQN